MDERGVRVEDDLSLKVAGRRAVRGLRLFRLAQTRGLVRANRQGAEKPPVRVVGGQEAQEGAQKESVASGRLKRDCPGATRVRDLCRKFREPT